MEAPAASDSESSLTTRSSLISSELDSRSRLLNTEPDPGPAYDRFRTSSVVYHRVVSLACFLLETVLSATESALAATEDQFLPVLAVRYMPACRAYSLCAGSRLIM